eukprot:scaffold49012_cov37-Tisochrysis_lutea.AAC.3
MRSLDHVSRPNSKPGPKVVVANKCEHISSARKLARSTERCHSPIGGSKAASASVQQWASPGLWISHAHPEFVSRLQA